MSNSPIGIFDSGVGGLSILKAINRHLPNENLLYFADSAYNPYGNLDKDALKQRCLFIANFFIQRGAKAMVIACNTATAIMAEWLRAEFEIPVIAIEPAIKPAAQRTRNQHIGVFATENTLASERYLKLIDTYATDLQVYSSHCPGFVEQVEKGELLTAKTLNLVEQYLNPMLDKKIDVLVLGCTHYPFLKPAIQKVAAKRKLLIIDTADAVSLQLTRVLAERGLTNFNPNSKQQFFTSAQQSSFAPIFRQLLGREVELESV